MLSTNEMVAWDLNQPMRLVYSLFHRTILLLISLHSKLLINIEFKRQGHKAWLSLMVNKCKSKHNWTVTELAVTEHNIDSEIFQEILDRRRKTEKKSIWKSFGLAMIDWTQTFWFNSIGFVQNYVFTLSYKWSGVPFKQWNCLKSFEQTSLIWTFSADFSH